MSDTNMKVIMETQVVGKGNIDDLKQSISGLEGSAKKATADITAMEQAVARFKTAISGISNGNFKAMSSATKQLRSDLDSIRGSDAIRQAFKDLDSGDPTKMLSAVKTLDTEYQRLAGSAVNASVEQKNLGKSISESASHASSSKGKFASLVSSLGRIAKLRFLRGIIRGISQAISEGANNIYQYSAALGNADASHFSGSMDALATTLLQVKNAVGSVIAPLMGSLLPAIQTVAGWFITAANAVAQFFAALGGQTTYTRAKEHATAWKEVATGAGSAAAAAQEYKNTILGFDEINALNDTPDGGGGGGGGGASAPDYSDMFEEVPLEKTGIMGLLNKLGQVIGPVLDELGTYVADWVDGTTTIIDGGITAVMGVFHRNKDEFYQGMDEIQSVFVKYNFFQTIAGWAYDALGAIRKFFAEVQIFLINGVIEIAKAFSFLDPVLEALGLPTIGDGIANLEKMRDTIVDHERVVDEVTQAYKDWLSGKLSSEGLHKKLYSIKTSTKGARDTIDELEKKYNEFWGINPSSDKQTKELGKIAASAKIVSDNIGTAKQKTIEFGNTNPSTSTIRNAIGSVASAVNTVIEKITGGKNSVTEFGKHNPSMENVKSAIAKPGASADTTTGKVWTMANTVSAFGHASIYPSGIINGIFSVGDAADRASGKLGVLAWNVGQIQTATIGKVKDVARAFLGYAEGGFVPTFAEGGIVPRFDGGGINSANLFLAHENGIPEMVGRIGNRTAVANQGQMVEAMAQGVRMAMSDLMSGSGNTEVNVYMDGHKIARAVDRQNQIKNRRFNVRMA